MGLVNQLSHRITVHARREITTALGELDFDYPAIKTVWAAVAVQGASNETLPGDSIRAKITHKFTLRVNALPEIQPDMYFMMCGQKYTVLYWQPNYRRNDRIEVFCSLEVE